MNDRVSTASDIARGDKKKPGHLASTCLVRGSYPKHERQALSDSEVSVSVTALLPLPFFTG